MKHMVDIHVVLATAEDFEQWEEHAEDVAEKFNTLLHLLYDRVEDDIATATLENMFQHIWETWSQDRHLLEIEEEDLCDWVDQFITTWEDEPSSFSETHY